MSADRPDILVIGAGVVGATAALGLLRRGLSVTLVDRKGVAEETSAGNAGGFAFPSVIPLATPGIMRKAPRWLLDPLGPLSIRPAYALRIAPWLWRFLRASAPARYEAALDAQAAMMRVSRAAFEELVAETSAEPLLQRDGQLELYESVAAFDAARRDRDAARARGVAIRELSSAEEIAEIQPGLSPALRRGVFTPDWINVRDPAEWTIRLAEIFSARGGRIERAEVRALAEEGGEAVAETATGRLRAGRIVVAAGAWSHRLAATLGDRIPLEVERGYNTTLPQGAFDLRAPVTLAEHAFVLSRVRGGVRVGGAVELAGLDLPPDWRRADAMLAKAARFFPGLRVGNGTRWMGGRPSLPDSLPVIGPAPRAPRVLYAFGHGHLGLTQSTGTARVLADLATGAPPPLDLAPFAPDRF